MPLGQDAGEFFPIRILRYIVAVILLVASLSLLAGWWVVRQSLPQLAGDARLPGLKAEVTVDRDSRGVPTIAAASLEDLLIAQGYVTAQDRLWQMDILRRAAAGELSEILGEATVPLDREMRVLGLRGAAEKSLLVLDAANRAHLDSYAAGVNEYIRQRTGNLPWEFRVLGYQPKPWTPADSLLIHAYMYNVLTSTWQWELNRAKVQQAVGPERAREMFVVDSPLDHFVVGGQADSQVAKPAPQNKPRAMNQLSRPQPVPASASLVPQALSVLFDFERDAELAAGSNNWVVGGVHTYSGKPILANDTHLQNDMPALWYIAHLKAPGYNVKGFSIPGGPLIVIGHNERIAWGFTNNGADVQDLYIESLNPENPKEYRVNGKWMPAEIRSEVIKVKGRPDHTLDVLVTRHGPVVKRDGNTAYALKWTATEPGGLGAGYSAVGFAQNWQEFREAMRNVPGPAQNSVYGDVDGNIGFLMAARVPVRKQGDGSVPLPGDTDDYEWTGYIPFDELPQLLNPPEGVIATANARVVGPAYPRYLTDRWYSPYRTSRIYDLLEERKGLRPEECIAIQTDILSAPHRQLAGQLAAAAKKHPPQDPRVLRVLDHIALWDGRADATSRFMAFIEFTRRELVRELLQSHLGSEASLYQWSRSSVFLENVLRDRPPHWLPKQYPDYDALLVAAADRAAARLETASKNFGVSRPEDPEQWRWGQFVQLEMLHPLARSGWLRRHLSIAGVDQSGSSFSVKQTGRNIGPAMRFVADLANLDNSFMNVTTGQSGQYLSRHYRDQFPSWYQGRGIPSPFSDAAEAKVRAHRLALRP